MWSVPASGANVFAESSLLTGEPFGAWPDPASPSSATAGIAPRVRCVGNDSIVSVRAIAPATRERLEPVAASLVLPGHGEAFRGGVAEAVRLTRDAPLCLRG